MKKLLLFAMVLGLLLWPVMLIAAPDITPEKAEKALNWTQLIINNWAIIGTILAALVIAFNKMIFKALSKFVDWWRIKSQDLHVDPKWASLPHVLDALDSLIFKVVDELQDLADEYKKASEDGKLTQEEIAHINKLAWQKFNELVPSALMNIVKALGIDLPSYFLSRVKYRIWGSKKHVEAVKDAHKEAALATYEKGSELKKAIPSVES